jgi:DMSO/TMAO reductase YedYZ molybdopterin-dependent catalytic subunit
MMNRTIPLLILLALMTGATAAGAQPALAEGDAVSAATQSRYRENEITEYQGPRLDPAVGPQDNSIKGVQHVEIDGYTLTIDGLVDQEVALTYEQVLALTAYERLVTLHCVEGWDARVLWKGALLDDLIALAGAKPEAVTVIFSAVDGYTTSLPLAAIREKGLILAYDANGLALPDEMGYPFIVVAEDKLGYKWARWVNQITLSDDANYQGFWESNGFSNAADVPVE